MAFPFSFMLDQFGSQVQVLKNQGLFFVNQKMFAEAEDKFQKALDVAKTYAKLPAALHNAASHMQIDIYHGLCLCKIGRSQILQTMEYVETIAQLELNKQFDHEREVIAFPNFSLVFTITFIRTQLLDNRWEKALEKEKEIYKAYTIYHEKLRNKERDVMLRLVDTHICYTCLMVLRETKSALAGAEQLHGILKEWIGIVQEPQYTHLLSLTLHMITGKLLTYHYEICVEDQKFTTLTFYKFWANFGKMLNDKASACLTARQALKIEKNHWEMKGILRYFNEDSDDDDEDDSKQELTLPEFFLKVLEQQQDFMDKLPEYDDKNGFSLFDDITVSEEKPVASASQPTSKETNAMKNKNGKETEEKKGTKVPVSPSVNVKQDEGNSCAAQSKEQAQASSESSRKSTSRNMPVDNPPKKQRSDARDDKEFKVPSNSPGPKKQLIPNKVKAMSNSATKEQLSDSRDVRLESEDGASTSKGTCKSATSAEDNQSPDSNTWHIVKTLSVVRRKLNTATDELDKTEDMKRTLELCTLIKEYSDMEEMLTKKLATKNQ